MKLTADTHALSAALAAVAPAVAARTTRPVLASVHLRADADGTLTLTATDQEVWVRHRTAGATVDRPGAVVVPPDRLGKILKTCGTPTVLVEQDGTVTRVRAGRARFDLPGEDADTFPADDGELTGTTFTLTAGTLRAAVARVRDCVERKESSRWMVTGVLLEHHAGRVRVVGTDTKVLGVADGDAPDAPAAPPKSPPHIVPVKALVVLDRLLCDDAEAVAVTLTDARVRFRGERGEVAASLIAGNFPPYASIVPKSAAVKIPLAVDAFRASVRQAAVMADGESKRVDLTFAPGRAVLLARESGGGSGEVEHALPDYAGDELKISFDHEYLLDILRAADGYETVTLEMTDGQKPAVFRADEKTLWLLMPMSS